MATRPNSTHGGFSLLEVIIATAILVGSSMILFRLLSTGQLHQQKADRHATAQIICQSLLDEILIDPQLRVNSEDAPIVGYSDWRASTEVAETDLTGLIRLRVAVYYSPVSLDSNVSFESNLMQNDSDAKPVCELVRWMPGGDNSGPPGIGSQL